MSQIIELVSKQTLATDGVFQAISFLYDYDYVQILMTVKSNMTIQSNEYMNVVVNKDTDVNNYRVVGTHRRQTSDWNDIGPGAFNYISKVSTVETATSLDAWTYAQVEFSKPLDTSFVHPIVTYMHYPETLDATSICVSGKSTTQHLLGPASPPNPLKLMSIYFVPNNYPTSLFAAGSTIHVMGWRTA